MKRIAIFCDGTWNTPDKLKNGKRCQTNVVKLANALSPLSPDGNQQVLYYDEVIGSENSLNFNSISLSPDPLGLLHESYRGLYSLQARHIRPIAIPQPERGYPRESLHPSVKRRYRNDSRYRPKNLDDYFNQYSPE